MHGQLKEAVVEILQRMEFKVQIATGVAALTQIAAEKAKESALDKVQKITGTEASARSLNESGSVVKEEPRTAAERAKEAAARAGRK
jgi:FtsZ-binding cell division protein ZapB